MVGHEGVSRREIQVSAIDPDKYIVSISQLQHLTETMTMDLLGKLLDDMLIAAKKPEWKDRRIEEGITASVETIRRAAKDHIPVYARESALNAIKAAAALPAPEPGQLVELTMRDGRKS